MSTEFIKCFILILSLLLLYFLSHTSKVETFSSEPYRALFFIHIPKNAGSTINVIFKKHLGMDMGRNYFLNKHQKYSDIKKKYKISLHHIPPKYFEDSSPYQNKELFCIVRNPYTRMISEYKYYQDYYKTCEKITPQGLNKFIQKIPKLQKKNPWIYDGHLIPQSVYVEGIDIKEENILKFERLEEDFEKLKTRYQMPDLKLTHHRKSPGKLDVSDYTPESIDIINNIYSSDFTKFNYSIKKK